MGNRHRVMSARVEEIKPASLPEYAGIPMRVEVRSVLEVREAGLGGMVLEESPCPTRIKDYDADSQETPRDWPARFDIRNWGLWLARHPDTQEAIGGAAVAWNTAGVDMLEGVRDLAVLWDLRVRSDCQGRGVGRAMFAAAAAFARSKGCALLKIETQNVNVPACRFYQAMGCHLGQIHRHAYRTTPRLASEVMLVWYLPL